MSGEQFSLVWNSFPRNLSSGLYTLLTDEQLVDVTLAAEGQILRAHKLILSVCSTYFRELFKGNSCKHPIVILKDVNYRDLSAMLHFMYQGEVNIKQEDIASFLKVAETLQIKGLTTESEKIIDNVEKNVSDLEEMLGAEKPNSDTTTCDTLEKQTPMHHQQMEQHCQRQNATPKDVQREQYFPDTNPLLNETCHRQNSNAALNYETQKDLHSAPLDTSCIKTDTQDETEEPLDCTADVHHVNPEPLDYTFDGDPREARSKVYTSGNPLYKPDENLQRQDFLPDMQLVPYCQDSQSQLFGPNNPGTHQSDFLYESDSHGKGRRTVKGIPCSSLPLETTLRVVSELGPTIRMERGKIIRMYSCPWCLRHFTRKENLKLHVRYIHGPLESLTCKLCGNKYKNSNSLRVHSYLYHNAKRDKHNKPLVGGGA